MQAIERVAKARPAGADFWKIAHGRNNMSELERINSIKSGLSVDIAYAAKNTFQMSSQNLVALLNLSAATFERRRRDAKPLDPAASERLDRIVSIALQAEEVFEDKQAAAKWMSEPNRALAGNTPLMHCETAIGAQQVRRILNALEWGGVA